jgi:aerobic carbon-monoxide dehydrogenase small subunit
MSKLCRFWNINGRDVEVKFHGLARLLDVLRDTVGVLSLKEGCGEGECGACSVLIDGEVHLACLVAAAQLDDGTVLASAEGLEETELGHELSEALDGGGAVQCGYCTPGVLVGSYALLSKPGPPPSELEIRQGLAGHLCRCTGYTKIISSVGEAARLTGQGTGEVGS